MPERQPPPEECANCGAEIPRHAKACPECGADERTGWRDESVYDGLDLPDAAFGDSPPGRPPRRGPSRLWLATALILIALSALSIAFLR